MPTHARRWAVYKTRKTLNLEITIMSNINQEHASIRVENNDYVVSITRAYVRIQYALGMERYTEKHAKLLAHHLEDLVSRAPMFDKFATARYMMKHNGLPYYPKWRTDVSDKDDYTRWTAGETRKRLMDPHRRKITAIFL